MFLLYWNTQNKYDLQNFNLFLKHLVLIAQQETLRDIRFQNCLCINLMHLVCVLVPHLPGCFELVYCKRRLTNLVTILNTIKTIKN